MKTAAEHILDAAYSIATEHDWNALTREAVAALAGIATGSVNVAWGTMDNLRSAVMKRAVEQSHLPTIVIGLVQNYPEAHAAPRDLQAKALASLIKG
jgi:AcrR family transcriptional regulator